MEVSFMHLAAIALTILATIGVAVYSARGVNSAAGFSLSGRKATAPRVAGSIVVSLLVEERLLVRHRWLFK